MATHAQPCVTPSFTTVPILPLAHARNSATKPAFLKELRDALLNCGFLYLSETGLPEDLVQKVCEETRQFFDEDVLPLEEKGKIEMKNEKSFLGWSRVS
jgi:isopenicillin N synthase-like dioxygenase